MTMANSYRSADRGFDDRDDRRDRGGRAATPGSLPIRLAEAAMRNPVTTGGVAVSVLMIVATVANAVVNQPLRHPHPIFDTRSPAARVEPRAAAPAGPAAVVPATQPLPTGLPNVLPRPKPLSSADDGLIRDLQTVLAERGFYGGPVDGVVGPATAEAIRACERRLGTTPTGEASELLLAALRAAPDFAAPPVQIAAQPAVKPAPAPKNAASSAKQAAVAPGPATAAPPSPPPPPSMRIASADAVAYPVNDGEAVNAVDADPPVFTGSIRRAAREPLAPGGDDRLQKLQRALIGAGYGPLKADGRWDDRSIAAVRRYEADHGWPVTGKPSDRLVWDLMAKGAAHR